jgi:hypothetical protein
MRYKLGNIKDKPNELDMSGNSKDRTRGATLNGFERAAFSPKTL